MRWRRSEYDDPDWAEVGSHLGEAFGGSIHELRSNDPPGRPFEPRREPIGFCVDPAAYRRAPAARGRRGRRRVVPA
jgi:hypothetical protein